MFLRKTAKREAGAPGEKLYNKGLGFTARIRKECGLGTFTFFVRAWITNRLTSKGAPHTNEK